MRRLLLGMAAIAIAACAFAADDPQTDEAAEQHAVVAAWETAQRSDPKTVAFEKTAPDTYHLKTTRFPYDGKVRIGNVVVRDLGPGSRADWDAYASVETVLDTGNHTLAEQYPESFADWSLRNHFYRQTDSHRWLRIDEFRHSKATAGDEGNGDWRRLRYLLLLVGSLALLILALVIQRMRESRLVMKSFRNSATVQQETRERYDELRSHALETATVQKKLLELNEEQTRLLREMLEALKQRGGPP